MRIHNTCNNQSNNVQVLQSCIQYDEDSDRVKYLLFEMNIKDNNGLIIHIYKAIKLVRIIRLPKSAKESLALMDMHAQVLSALWEKEINLITLISNIIYPIPLGLLFLYGVQGVAYDLETAKKNADLYFASLVALLQGTYRTLEFRPVIGQEMEWLREKMYNMPFMSVMRGLPAPKQGGVDIGIKGPGGTNSNVNSQDTTEEFIAGMADKEYVVQILSTPVKASVLEAWLVNNSKLMTLWNGQLTGQSSMSFGISLPMMYMANMGASNGSSHNYTDAESIGITEGTTEGTTEGNTVGTTDGVSNTVSHSNGTSHSSGVSSNEGTSSSEDKGGSHTDSTNQSTSHSEGINQSNSESWSNSESNGTSSTHTDGTSHTITDGTSSSKSQSTNQSTSSSSTTTSSFGNSGGQSTGSTYTESTNTGVNTSNGNSNTSGTNVDGRVLGIGAGVSTSNSNSASSGQSAGASESNASSVTNNTGYSMSEGTSNSSSSSKAYSSGTTSGTSHSVANGTSSSNSTGTSHTMTTGNGGSVTNGTSNLDSTSLGTGRSDGTTWRTSNGTSSGTGASSSDGTTSTATNANGTTHSVSKSNTSSVSNTISNSTSKTTSIGTSSGTTTNFTQGTSATTGVAPSLNMSKSFQWKDQEVENILELLEFQNYRLNASLNGRGAFFTDIYIATPDENTKESAEALAKSAWSDKNARICPLQAVLLDEMEQKRLLYRFNCYSQDTTKEGEPNGLSSYKYSTILLPEEYTAYTHLPRISEGGVYADVNDIPKLAVPSMRQGEIYLGQILSAERYTQKWGYLTPFPFRIHNSELMHAIFTGESRSGKTEAAMRFVGEMINNVIRPTGKRLRVVVMDPKQDWRGLASFVDINRFNFYSLGNPEFLPIKLNICKIPQNVYPQQWVDGLIEIYCRAYGLGERGKSVLAETFFELYDDAGVFEENWRETAPEKSSQITLCKIYDRMKQHKIELEDPMKSGKGRVGNDVRDAYARVLDRMQVFGREFTVESRLFGSSEGMGIDELIGNDDITVLESYGLEKTFKNFIFGVITSAFFKYAQAHEDGFLAENQYETVLVIEEANEVLTGQDSADKNNNSPLPGQSEFECILDQAAGLGLFIFSITQKIASMPSSVIANSGLVFAGKISRPEDEIAFIRKIGREERYEDRDLVKWFPRSPIGWFVCRSSRNYDFKETEPVLVSIAKLERIKISNRQLEHIMNMKEVNQKICEIRLNQGKGF